MELGKKIKQMRNLKELTQEELADRCELTKGYISQIENDLTSPSIATLSDILSVLGSNLSDFFRDDSDEQVVFNEDDFCEKNSSGVIWKWLIPNAQKNKLEPVMMNLEPRTSTTEYSPYDGEEFGFILEGNITIHLGNNSFLCKKGEAFYFSADKTHYISNDGNKNACFIWISTPPNF